MPRIYKRKCNNCGKYYEGFGKFYCSNICRSLSIDWRKKHSESVKGQIAWNKNKYLTSKHKKNLSISQTGKHNSPETEFKKGQHPSRKTEFKKEDSRISGKNNPNWKNGGVTGKIYYCKVCECPVTFMSAIKGLGMCKSCSHKGRLNFTFGKPAPHGKRIRYKGISMRSSWETLFAQFLDLSGIKYKYEPERFYFEDCSYCPDFYLPEFDLYIEIKGYWRPNTRKRFNLFKWTYLNKNIKILMQKDLQEIGIQV